MVRSRRFATIHAAYAVKTERLCADKKPNARQTSRIVPLDPASLLISPATVVPVL
jgi:hypothetical protein